MATLLQSVRRSKTSLALPGASLQGVVRTNRRPWETAPPEGVDPAPPGHVVQLVWPRLPEDDEREAAELPDIDPAPLAPRCPLSGSFVSWTRRSWRMPPCAGSTWVTSAGTTFGGNSHR